MSSLVTTGWLVFWTFLCMACAVGWWGDHRVCYRLTKITLALLLIAMALQLIYGGQDV